MDHILVLHRFGIGSRAPTMRSQGWKPLFIHSFLHLQLCFCTVHLWSRWPHYRLLSLQHTEVELYSGRRRTQKMLFPKFLLVKCFVHYCIVIAFSSESASAAGITKLRSSITLWGRQIPELKNKNSKLQTAVDRRYWICRLANRRVMSVRQIFVGRHVAQNKERRRHIEPTNTVADYSMSLFTPTDMSACRSTLGRYIDWHVPDVLCLTTKFVDCEQPVWSDLTEILYKDSEGKYDI